MENNTDWYPQDRPTERILYGNIEAKVDDYKIKYPCLTEAYAKQIHAMCLSFIEGFDKLEQNRATAKQMTGWFENLVETKLKGNPVPGAPVFHPFSMPDGATTGLEQQCRDFARLLKNQPNYDVADGLDLMIERGEQNAPDLTTSEPELHQTVALTKVITEWKKAGFDALELQYRKAGTEMWQPVDKSTEKTIEFEPPLTTPGVPEKFEFRAVYILKNQRVGNWSPIYTQTVG